MPSQAIYRFDQPDRERVFAWARYVFWADVECQQYEAHEPGDDEPTTGLLFVLMAQWYAALWVAIEGWRECPLSDSTVDELLTDPAFERNLQLLRRFRNGVYHYQQKLIDDRLIGFLSECTNTIPWAFLVHSEFKRVLWEFVHPEGLTPNIQDEMADGIRKIIGWLPTDVPDAAPLEAAIRCREVAEMILKDGGRDTQGARDLLSSVKQLSLAAREYANGWAYCKRTMIDSLKAERKRS
jgi:hypothetical protein